MVQPINYMSQIPQVDLAESLTSGLRLGATFRQMQDQQIARQQAQQAKQQFATDLQAAQADGSQKAWLNMIGKYPQFREAFGAVRKGLGEEQVKNEFISGFEISMALENNAPDVAKQRLQILIDGNKNSGKPTGIYQQAFDLIDSGNVTAAQAGINKALSILDPDRFEKTVKAQSTAAEAPSKLSEQVAKASKALTAAEVAVATAPDDIARATALREFEQAKAKKEKVDARYADRKNKLNIRKLERQLTSEGKNDGVQSSKITPDGTSIIVTRSGNTRVIGADGVELTGQARVDAVRGSEVFGAGMQGLRSGSRKAGEIGQVEAQKAFVTLGKIATNISNLDSAVAALDAGATTGVIASKFPNWKASTIELQNIQRNLGLDIIGSVTFGALSEGELSLALETALPLNMNEKQLKDWLIRKKDAQVKLSKYITEQARFLSVPGQTIGQWLQQSEKIGGRPGGMTAPGTGSTVTVDY
jgi:hypothetical protein